MTPIVDGLEAEFAGRLTVVRLDAAVSENAQLQSTLTLRGHPTFAVLDDTGNVTARFTGPQTAEILREAVTAVLTK